MQAFIFMPMPCLYSSRYLGIMLIAVVLFQCSPKEVAPTFIPADVSSVIAFDMKRMSSKAVGWKDVLSMDFLQQMTGNSGKVDMLGKILNGGFDYTANAYLFAKADEQAQNSYVALSFVLQDVKKFEKNLNVTIQKQGDRKYIIPYKGLLITWEKKKALAISSPNFDEQNLQAIAEAIYKTKKENSLEAKNQNFNTALQKDADITTWINYQSLPKAWIKQLERLAISIPSEAFQAINLIEQAILHTNFEKGEIKTTIKGICNESILKNYQKLLKGGINANIAQNIPIENPSMLVGVGVGTQGIEGLLGNSEMMLAGKVLIGFLGTSIPDILGLFTGDAVLALGDVKISTDLSEQEAIVCVGTTNSDKVIKLINDFDGFLKIKKKKDFFIVDADKYGDLFLIVKENKLYLTVSEKLKDQLLASTTKLNANTLALFNNKMAVMEVDYSKLLKNLPEANQVAGVLDKFQFTAQPIAGNIWEAESTLKMKDKNSNALAVLFEMTKKLPISIQP